MYDRNYPQVTRRYLLARTEIGVKLREHYAMIY